MSQVRVDETKHSGFLSFTPLGVVTASPDTLTLPRHSWTSDPAVLCVNHERVYRFGREVRLSYCNEFVARLSRCLLAWSDAETDTLARYPWYKKYKTRAVVMSIPL